MGRKEDLRIVDPVLTELARGYTNAEFAGDELFPFASVPKEAGKIPSFGKEAFLEFATERALRAKSNRLPVEDRDKIDYVCDEHDATYPIDYREDDESQFNEESYGSFRASEAIRLRHEKISADIATTAANYPTGSKVTLSGTDQWTDKANSDPIGDIKTARAAIRAKIGKNPNVLVLGATSFEALQDHPGIIERIKYSEIGVVTVELLQTLFNIEKVVVANALKASDALELSDMWGDNAILAYVPKAKTSVERSIYEPSFGYTLHKEGYPQVDKFDEEGGKIMNVRSTDNFVVKLMGADAGYLISDTNG